MWVIMKHHGDETELENARKKLAHIADGIGPLIRQSIRIVMLITPHYLAIKVSE